MTKYPWEQHGEWASRILDVEPEIGRTTVYWYNQYDKTQRLVEHWDVNEIVEFNKAMYAAKDERSRWSDWEHVGKIPISIAHDVLKKTNNGRDREAVNRWLKDPENRHFVSRPIRFGI